MTLSIGLARQGAVAESLEASDRGFVEQVTLGEHLDLYPWVHLMNRCEALATAGRFEEYDRLATAQYEESLAEGSIEQQAFFAWYLAKAVRERGRVKTSVRRAREAVALFSEMGRPLFMRSALGSFALAAALAGRTEQSAAAVVAMDELPYPATMYMASSLLGAKAWTAVADGRVAYARGLLEEAATVGESSGDFVGAAAALHDIARLGHAKRVVGRLEELVNRIEGDLGVAMLVHTRALVRKAPEALAEVSANFEDMGADLLAADAGADAAVAWRNSGELRKSTAAERRVAMLVSRCEGATTPAIVAMGDGALLTPAQRETAVLAAGGRSNKDIASELFVSVRTVETRLNHVYVKLGISGRHELAAIFRTGYA